MKVLVVAAHPDDEMLGCAATMARHVDEGDSVDILLMAEGATSRDQTRDVASRAGELSALQSAAFAAASAVGANQPTFGGLPDNRMDERALLDIVKVVEDKVQSVQPQVVYTHSGGDLNVDHRLTNHAVVTACRGMEGSSVEAMYAFEIASSTEWSLSSVAPRFEPNYYVNVSNYVDAKLKALEAYDVEMRPFPHPRSYDYIRHLAAVRGAVIGHQAAEAFEVLRAYR